MPTIPNLNGAWGGYVYIRSYGLTGTHVGITEGVRTGLTMRIIQQPGSNTAGVQLRSGYFGRMCGLDEEPLSPFSNPPIPVCPKHVDIPLTDKCPNDSGAPGANPFSKTNVGLITKTYPLNYGTHNTNVEFEMPYHMDFWTHTCNYRTGYTENDVQRHWCVALDSVSPVGGLPNVPYIEVRFIVVNKPGHNARYWFCTGTLDPYHD